MYAEVDQGDIVRINGAVEETGHPPGTIRQLCHQKRIPFIKRGRAVFFSRRALRAWLASFEVPVRAEIGPSGRARA